MADLKTKYMGLELKNPVIVGSSGLTNSVENIIEIEKNGAAAVVLKSLFEEQILHEINKAHAQDEIGVLATSFNKMVSKINKTIEEAKQKGEEAERTAADAQTSQEYLAKNTQKILTEMDKFAEGDLTVSVTPENKDDDIGKLFNGFKRFFK